MKHVLIIYILCLISAQAQTYEGVIGKHQIFLDLGTAYNGNYSSASYFYKAHLKKISLKGNYETDKITIFKKYSDKKEQKELFTLSVSKNKMVGIWQHNGRVLNVELTKTTKSVDIYKLQNLKYIRDSIATYGKKELVWFTEKHSKKSLFRLGSGFTQSEREFMNPKLDTIHAKHAIETLDCDWSDGYIDLELASNQYISFTEHVSIHCGGVHPVYAAIGYNFDIKNNVQLEKLTDIYPNLNHYQLLKKKYENDTDLDLQSECSYFTNGEKYWEYYSWVFTKKGVKITPSYSHAMTSCEIGFLLTYKELEQRK